MFLDFVVFLSCFTIHHYCSLLTTLWQALFSFLTTNLWAIVLFSNRCSFQYFLLSSSYCTLQVIFSQYQLLHPSTTRCTLLGFLLFGSCWTLEPFFLFDNCCALSAFLLLKNHHSQHFDVLSMLIFLFSIGTLEVLHSTHVSLRRSSTYFLWEMKISYFE